MFHYKFPVIKTIDDVLPHIDDCFRVSEQNGLTYINYTHMSPDTFPFVSGEDDLRNKVRRECRGIAFGPDGRIVSRPFHKFFNVNERDDSRYDESFDYFVFDKLDGSMVRPVPIGDTWRLATKAGVTDVAMKAELALDDRHKEDIKHFLSMGFTPIYEFTSPDNRIVLRYEEPSLTLIGLRSNTLGRYVTTWGDPERGYNPISCSSIENLNVKSAEDLEGIVIFYTSGHMLKLKSDWYVKLHRAKEYLSNERKFIKMILEDGLDDVLPALSDEDKDKFRRIEDVLWKEIDNNADLLDFVYKSIRLHYPTKKDYAIESNFSSSPFRPLIFKLWDKKVDTAREAIVQYILSSMSNNDKWSGMKKTLYLTGIPGGK